MTVETLSLVIDFGLVVLVWLVQLIIYPSLAVSALSTTLYRHRSYMFRMGFVAAPLMMAQLLLHALQLFWDPTVFNIIKGLLVLLVWALTFSVFVPLHNAIAFGRNVKVNSVKLVHYNWWRTGIWTGIFLLSLIR